MNPLCNKVMLVFYVTHTLSLSLSLYAMISVVLKITFSLDKTWKTDRRDGIANKLTALN